MPQILSNASQMNWQSQNKPSTIPSFTLDMPQTPSVSYFLSIGEQRRVRRPRQNWKQRLARMEVSFIHGTDVMYVRMLEEAASRSFNELCPSLKGALPRHSPPWLRASSQRHSKSAGSRHPRP